MDKLKLETMKALMEALPSLAASGAKRIKYGEFEVEFHEPTARRIIETVQEAKQPSEQELQAAGWTRLEMNQTAQQPADVTYQMRVEHADGTVTAPTTPVQVEHPTEPDEEDEEPGDPLFHHLPPSQRPTVS